MNLDRFVSDVYNRLLAFIRDNTDIDVREFSEENIDAAKNQIRNTIRETADTYDSNNFPRVVRSNIAADLADLADSAGIELPSLFSTAFEAKLEQISDEQITQFYLVDDVIEQATETTQAEPVVDMDTRVQELMDNSSSVREKTIRQMVDDIAQEENFTNRAGLIENVTVEDSIFFGENKKIVIEIVNTDTEVDNIVNRVIDGVKGDDFVVEVVTYDDVDSVHLEGARQFGVNHIEYNLDQKAVESYTSTHYFPETNEQMQIRLSSFLEDKERNIVYSSETQRVQALYPGGPLITTNQTGHQGFNVHLSKNTRPSEVQSVLDKSKIKAVMVAGNKSGGTAGDMSPVFKGGIGKYFKKLARKAEGERFQAIANKPGYTIGYVFVSPDGSEHIVSFVHSDVSSYRVHSNDIDYSSDWKKANIQTNFFTFHPAAVDGYYPNIYDGTFSKKKFLIQMKVNEWFQGMLHLADLDGVTIDQSPINGQVANLYQKGGFIWTDELHLYNDRLAPFEGTGGMIRLPSGNRNVIDGWKAELNTKPEWQVINNESTIVNTRWSSPDQVTMVAKKRKYGPGDLKYSERHRALISLSQLNFDNIRPHQIRTANEAILRISGLYGLDASTLLQYYESPDMRKEAKYLFAKTNLDDILNKLSNQTNPKFLAEAILNSTHLEKITGLDVDLLSDQEKNIINYREKIPIAISQDGKLNPTSAYSLFESIVDGISPSILNEFDITLATDITDVDEIDKIYLDNFEDAQQQLQEAAQTPERDRFTSRVQTEEGLRSYSFESIRQLYNENVGNYEGFYGQIRQTLADNPQLMDDDFGLHVVDSDHVSTYLVDDDALVAPILEQSNNRSFITDEARHIFTRNLQALLEKENSTLLTSDINFVGSRDGINYIEIGTVQERVNDIGDLVLHKEYTTYSLDRSRDGTNIRLRNVLSTAYVPTHEISNALALMFTEYDVPLDYSVTGGLLDKIHPSGTIGYQMGVVNSRDAGTVNRSRGNTSYGFEDPQVLREATTPDALQTTLDEFRNQPRRPKVSNTDVSPQPFYTKMVFEDIRAGVNNNVNDVINLLSDLVDNKTTGAFSLNIYKGNYTTLVGQVLKRHGQPMQFIGMPGNESNFVVRGNRIPDDLFIGDATLVAPHQDFMNGVILESLQNPQVDRGGLFHLLGNQKIDSANNGEVVRHYDVAAETFVPLVDDDNLPRIRANYSLGTDIGDGGVDFVGSAFNPDRTPVGSKPDPMTLRKIARSFAKTKTGKTLGLAWKTVDIGETLIAKGFAQAQKAAAAAGAATLGGAAAFAATLWALYEVSNLIVAAGQQIPELRNVIAKRNEILRNGEEWEKQIVEETFWQDYGPQIIEALQRAGDRSPSELLSDKIWSFTLDNLRRQSQGEVFEDALIDTSEDLDIRDDIYRANIPNDYKLQQMQNSIDYDKVLTGYYNNRPEANVIANRTLQLANDVYNRDR